MPCTNASVCNRSFLFFADGTDFCAAATWWAFYTKPPMQCIVCRGSANPGKSGSSKDTEFVEPTCGHIHHTGCARNWGGIRACTICVKEKFACEQENAAGETVLYVAASHGPQDGILDMSWKHIQMKQRTGFPLTAQDILETGPFMLRGDDKQPASSCWVNTNPLPESLHCVTVDAQTFVYEVVNYTHQESSRAKAANCSRCLDAETISVLRGILLENPGRVSVASFKESGLLLADLRQLLLMPDSSEPMSLPYLTEELGIPLLDMCSVFPDMQWSTAIEMGFDVPYLAHCAKNGTPLGDVFKTMDVTWDMLVRDVIAPYFEQYPPPMNDDATRYTVISQLFSLRLSAQTLCALRFTVDDLFLKCTHVRKSDIQALFKLYDLKVIVGDFGMQQNHLFRLKHVTRTTLLSFLIRGLGLTVEDASVHFDATMD